MEIFRRLHCLPRAEKQDFKAANNFQDNIAFNKPAWQLHQFIPDDDFFNASNAVDGRKSDLRAWRGQCAISDNDQRTATWRVDLQNILSIRHITIYYRTENAAWERADGELCFHDTNYTRDTIPAVLNVTCPVHGQYVIYYNERKQEGGNPDGYSQYAFNELCEVEVYGCPVPGYYGPDCSIPCPDTCRYCHIETGVCQGCKPGYQGHQCELQCDGLKYGAGCKEDCGTCLGYTQCHHINGTCLQGCHFGYEGILCKTKCSPWKFGKNCAQNCSENCVKDSIICKGTTGECMGGCRPGWEGLQCNMVCFDRKYGENCSQSCGRCKGHKKCHHVYGTCFDGCDRGFNGMLCGEECESQYHGYNCADNCSTACVNQTCNSIDGTCLQMMTVQEQKVGPEDINLVPILGGVVGVALACLLVVVILLMLRRYSLLVSTLKLMYKEAASDFLYLWNRRFIS
ncbi:multiple epidermal growth factor-like domains protein 10 [Ostrea edulis]|uniref:multiple epidermal growth factor-like domains protein 10 n=1 Tax=Ostrea edulis TaxID=37623 RepID=UPI0024AE9F70|nr:multiple epidermal growth factor-like domains protein 10 [Ostrea edulis]